MKKIIVNTNLTAYEFDELDGFLTYTYVLTKADKYFVIDTFCGSQAMEQVKEDLEDSDKEIIVVNTHAHWDHVWGNCAFDGSMIIGHTLTRDEMRRSYREVLEKNKRYIMGTTTYREPNLVFERQIQIDDVKIFYTPGHTKDCISLYDEESKSLVVGDNLELPLVYLESQDLDPYIKSLESYKRLDMNHILGGHNLEIGQSDLEEILQYLYNMREAKPVVFAEQDKARVHEANMRTLNGR